jgi:hypothetical protein
MNAEIFKEWLDRQGHHTIRTRCTQWYDAAPRVFQAFPYHWTVHPDEAEVIGLLREKHGVCLRYSSSISNPSGRISYHAVCNNKFYGLKDIDRRSRQNVRTGLTKCSVERISLERLAAEGWKLESDTCNRQSRRSQYNGQSFQKKILCARGLPGFEAWGALVQGNLAAYILCLQVEDTVELLMQACQRDALRLRVNHALAFTVTQTLLERNDIRSVFYTLQSLDAPASVDEFKFRMGYSAKPIRQRVVFHPLLSLLVNKLSYAGLKQLRKLWPYKPYITKAEGMARFYLSGKASASEQDWPECLSANKAELLNKLVGSSPEETKRISSN